jgi:hypothetical protein
MLAAQLVLGLRFRWDPRWAPVSGPVLVLALGSAVALAVFASRVAEPWNGVVQRAAVTLALAAEALIAARMLILARRARALDPRPGRKDAGTAVSAPQRGSLGREDH